jgi:hypothetical protein
MTHRDADRFKLAVDAVWRATKVKAAATASSGTVEVIDMHRRLDRLRQGDEGLLRRTLHSLNTLAASPRLFAFRLVMTALAESLPRTCSAAVSAEDVRTAALDLTLLANEAKSLHAPDVAVILAEIIAALLGHDSAIRTPLSYERH